MVLLFWEPNLHNLFVHEYLAVGGNPNCTVILQRARCTVIRRLPKFQTMIRFEYVFLVFWNFQSGLMFNSERQRKVLNLHVLWLYQKAHGAPFIFKYFKLMHINRTQHNGPDAVVCSTVWNGEGGVEHRESASVLKNRLQYPRGVDFPICREDKLTELHIW